MKSVITLYLRFTGREYSPLQKILSMVPGFIIFLVISPFLIFQLSLYISGFIPVVFPRGIELGIMVVSFLIAIALMTWALLELWFKGNGTPAPITPTHRLVTTGPYKWSRNPIELGTNIYFLSLGIFFDALITGFFCMFFGLVLGTAYIKLIEEKEMVVRFGEAYKKYLQSVPFMALPFLFKLKAESLNKEDIV